MGELVIKNDKLAKTKEAGNTPLDVELFQNKIKSFEQVGNYFSTIVNSYKEIKQNINPEEMYVVKFTQDQLKKFQNGEIDFQKTADRKSLLPNFVTKGTNNDIVSKARLEKIVMDNPEVLQNIIYNVNQLANAQKINDLEILLSEVKQLSLEIKQGQKDDRRAKILGAESTINQALLMSDDIPHKQFLLLNSINQLNEGREALIKEFEREINKQIPIPNSKFMLFLKSLFDDKFNEDISHSFFELNDQFSYIIKASDLLAKTYLVTGNDKLLDTIYSPIKSLVEDNREYVSKLVELQDLDNEEQQCQIKWCIEPNDFIAQIGIMELLEKDIVSIELTGEELLNGEQHG